MKSIPFAFMLIFCVAIWEFGSSNPVAMSCDSCGAECARACGTRHFRSCCFNYVKKRSSPAHSSPMSINQMRFEMLYQPLPYGKYKLQSKNDQEQKPRKVPTINDLKAENSDYGTPRNHFKPWKDNEVPIEVIVEDYDERRTLPESRQKVVYDV